jgi:hypothetical protein
MNDINLALKIEDINLVLSALSNLPFIQVHELIGKIQVQAAAQLTAAASAPPINGTATANGTAATNGTTAAAGARASMQLENN